MKNYFLLAILTFSTLSFAQAGSKVGYIDMNYILEKLPSYAEAKSKLDQRAATWKQEIEVKKNAIAKLKKELQTEKVILTKEMLAEREDEIKKLEVDLLDFQEKRFGHKGDLAIQKATIIKPLQDQIFNIVQDIAETRKYDLIFDKASDLSILFAAKRFDVSDMVLREIRRSDKKNNYTDKELKALEEKDKKEDDRREDPRIVEKEKAHEEKQKQIQDTKEERQRLLDERKAAADKKRQELQEAKLKAIEERKAAAEKRKQELLEAKQKAADERKAEQDRRRQEIENKNKN